MKGVKTLTLSTPPPSVNAMWRAIVRGRRAVNILSKEGRDWKEAAERELAGQIGIGCGAHYWRADILVPNSRCDIDNLTKGILDALVASEKTPDDRYLCDLRIRFHGGNSVIISVKQEEISKWATIRKASKSLIKKLVKNTS